MINRNFIKKHITAISICIFVLMFGAINYFRPPFLYNKDGSLREFGLGFKNKTVIPIWLISIIFAILSYVFVLYYLAVPKLRI